MRRRKLLISIGALGAGGTAAFGTEAFTSVEAERSVDVTVAGDESAFLAIQPLSGNNANDYVTTESDDTVALNFDGDDSTSGSGVNQDAVTQVEDLFKIINQGTQTTSVFFEDESDVVTFRVTRSTDTTTEGSNGESLEGADNSVELETGEQVAVGITVDTLTQDASGSLVDDVTIRADAGASAPDQSIPKPEYVVDGTGDEDKAFSSVADALDTDTGEVIESGAVLGIEGTINEDLSGQNINRDSGYGGNGNLVDIDTSNLTVVGVTSTNAGDSTPTLSLGNRQTLRANADGITLRNLDIEEPGSAGRTVDLAGDDITANGLSISKTDVGDGGSPGTAGPHIQSNGADVTITNCDLQGSPIGLNAASESATVINNSIQDVKSEGIFLFSCPDLKSIELTGNLVDNHNTGGGKPSEIKVDQQGVNVNGISSSNPDDQRVALLQDNDVNTVLIKPDGNKVLGTKVSSQFNSEFAFETDINSLQDVVEETGSSGLVFVEPGTYQGPVQVVNGETNLTIRSADGPGRTVIDATGTSTSKTPSFNAQAVRISADGVTIDGFNIVGDDAIVSGVFVAGGEGGGDNVQIVNNTIEGMSQPGFGGPSDNSAGIVTAAFGSGDSNDATKVNEFVARNNTVRDIGNTAKKPNSPDDGTRAQGIALIDIAGGTAGDGATIEGNDISNLAGQDTTTGIAVQPLDRPTENGTNLDPGVDIQNNEITGSDVGIALGDSGALDIKGNKLNQIDRDVVDDSGNADLNTILNKNDFADGASVDGNEIN